jgi:hypothetical protein
MEHQIMLQQSYSSRKICRLSLLVPHSSSVLRRLLALNKQAYDYLSTPSAPARAPYRLIREERLTSAGIKMRLRAVCALHGPGR